MKNMIINATVISSIGLFSAQTMATGLVSLPTTGFSVGSSTSAYTLCNGTGNFGAADSTQPTTSANNTCAVFPTNYFLSPVSGYTLAASSSASFTYNSVTIGTVDNRMWRNSSTNMCVFGVRIRDLTGNDYDSTRAGVQSFEVNDVTYGGFAAYNGSSAVNAGYASLDDEDTVAYRVGRTHTAVQFRADEDDEDVAADGYVGQPLTTSAPAASTAINGLATDPDDEDVPTAAQQAAALSANWVTFTTDANAIDDDGSSAPDSGMYYIEASCPSATYTTSKTNDIIRLRQTGQETDQLIEITLPGYVPGTGASASTY